MFFAKDLFFMNVSLQKKKVDSDDESDVAIIDGSDDEFDALVSSKPAAPREKPGRRAATKVSCF